MLGLMNNLYSYTSLDSHLPTHKWDPGSKLGAHQLRKGEGYPVRHEEEKRRPCPGGGSAPSTPIPDRENKSPAV